MGALSVPGQQPGTPTVRTEKAGSWGFCWPGSGNPFLPSELCPGPMPFAPRNLQGGANPSVPRGHLTPGDASADPLAYGLPWFWLMACVCVCVFARSGHLPSTPGRAGRTRRGGVRSQVKNAAKTRSCHNTSRRIFVLRCGFFYCFFSSPLFHTALRVGQWARLCFCLHSGWLMPSAH